MSDENIHPEHNGEISETLPANQVVLREVLKAARDKFKEGVDSPRSPGVFRVLVPVDSESGLHQITISSVSNDVEIDLISPDKTVTYSINENESLQNPVEISKRTSLESMDMLKPIENFVAPDIEKLREAIKRSEESIEMDKSLGLDTVSQKEAEDLLIQLDNSTTPKK